MSDGVIFAELHMIYGEPQESSDLVGVATSPVFSLFKRRRGQLFTVVEPSFPGAEQICRQLIQSVEDEYFRDSSRTVTTSLRSAMSAANEKLRAENSSASPDRQLRVGISCAAIRGDEVYIAQVAPASAFILHGDSVKRVFSSFNLTPDISIDGNDPPSEALGALLEPHVTFAYSSLQEGDMVVLASGSNWKLIPDRYVQEAGKHIDPEMAASELYGQYLAHARRPTTSLVVIRVSQLPVRKRREEPQPQAEAAAPVEDRRELYEAPFVESSVAPGRAGDRERARDRVSLPEDAGRSGASPRGVRSGDGPRTKTPWVETVKEPATRPSIWSRVRPGGSGGKPPLYPPGPPLEPVGKSSVKLRGRSGRVDGPTLPSWVLRVVVMVLLAAIFVVAARTGMEMWQSWQLGDPAALLQEAEAKRAQAASEADPASARSLLVESYDLLNRALRARNDESTRNLAATVQSDIDRIDKTVRIGNASVLIDYAPIADDTWNLTQMLLDGTNLYVLDEGMDRIFQYSLTSNGRELQEPDRHPVLVKRGDKLDGAVIGDLLSLTWMPAGQLRTSPAMFALESGRSIVSHDPRIGLSRIEVSESEKWGSIQAISGFAGGLYLLDTKQQGVFYYPPTKNGYESQPYTIVDSNARVDLSAGLDIALDGNLYILTDKGAIARFSREGRPLDFDGTLPSGPMAGAIGLFANSNTRSLYVVDEREQRIVQFSPEGKLQRQFMADGTNVSFKELRDVFVDEAGRKAYVLAHKSLLVFDLPPMQQEG